MGKWILEYRNIEIPDHSANTIDMCFVYGKHLQSNVSDTFFIQTCDTAGPVLHDTEDFPHTYN